MGKGVGVNALETVGTIVWATTKQRRVPNRILGRVSSFDWFVSIGLLPVSFALTSPWVQRFDAAADGRKVQYDARRPLLSFILIKQYINYHLSEFASK